MNISTCILTHSVQITPSKTGINGNSGIFYNRIIRSSHGRLSFPVVYSMEADMDVKNWPLIPSQRPYKWNETIWGCNSCALYAETCCQTRNQSPKTLYREVPHKECGLKYQLKDPPFMWSGKNYAIFRYGLRNWIQFIIAHRIEQKWLFQLHRRFYTTMSHDSLPKHKTLLKLIKASDD